ncbi:unnamed protein product, partial [Prorocentrum cordatum]
EGNAVPAAAEFKVGDHAEAPLADCCRHTAPGGELEQPDHRRAAGPHQPRRFGGWAGAPHEGLRARIPGGNGGLGQQQDQGERAAGRQDTGRRPRRGRGGHRGRGRPGARRGGRARRRAAARRGRPRGAGG